MTRFIVTLAALLAACLSNLWLPTLGEYEIPALTSVWVQVVLFVMALALPGVAVAAIRWLAVRGLHLHNPPGLLLVWFVGVEVSFGGLFLQAAWVSPTDLLVLMPCVTAWVGAVAHGLTLLVTLLKAAPTGAAAMLAAFRISPRRPRAAQKGYHSALPVPSP